MTGNQQFCDHAVVQQSPQDYDEICVEPQLLLKAWSTSFFAHELLTKEGTVKPQTEMKDATLSNYMTALESLKRDETLTKPVIGVGMMDGIEIGIGREIVAVCAVQSVSPIHCHVRKAQAKDVKKLLNL